MDESAANLSEDDIILLEEHLLLGASLTEGSDGRRTPLTYLGVNEKDAFEEGTALVDLSGLGCRLVSGPAASSLVTSVFAGEELAIGQIRPEAALMGDGALGSIALLARTGDQEYAWWDLVGRGDILNAWVAFVTGIQKQGVRPFAGVALEDASSALVPLLLWGSQAPAVLSDYLQEQALPEPHTIANRNLDRIGCLVGAPVIDDKPCYLVLVPPRYARVLWRSFLSFGSVTPVGSEAFVHRVRMVYPFASPLASQDGRISVDAQTLASAGLLRERTDFIGYRALASAD